MLLFCVDGKEGRNGLLLRIREQRVKTPASVTRWELYVIVRDIVRMLIDVDKILENSLVSKEVGHSTRNGFDHVFI